MWLLCCNTRTFSRVYLFVCFPVRPLTFESLDLETLFLVCGYIFRISMFRMLGSSGQGQGHSSEKAQTSLQLQYTLLWVVRQSAIGLEGKPVLCTIFKHFVKLLSELSSERCNRLMTCEIFCLAVQLSSCRPDNEPAAVLYVDCTMSFMDRHLDWSWNDTPAN